MRSLRTPAILTACVLVVVAAQSGDGEGLYYGKPLGMSDASFIGEMADDLSGYSVSSAGDVDGDGYDDILIGAPYNLEGGWLTGQTYLILGKATEEWSMDTPLSSADASFWGGSALDYSGYSVSSAGDVNDDGFDDILIGAYGNSAGGTAAGQTYLILGKDSGWSMNTSLSSSDASFIGEVMGDHAGESVSSAGDVNGDGFDDILIGAPHNGTNAGQTYLILGKETGWSMGTLLSSSDASFIGEASGDLSGCSVSSAGDVDGDGYDDILIGAEHNDYAAYNSDRGQTYLILGKATGWAMDTPLSSSDASFYGELPDDYSGCSVSSAGDVNQDGYDDILIGAWGNDQGGTDAGKTYLIRGRPAGHLSMRTPLSSSEASFIGQHAGDRSGWSVSSAGDVNPSRFFFPPHSPYRDILIGAPRWNFGSSLDRGRTYLILGKRTGWSQNTNLLNADASFHGEAAEDMSGYSVSCAGDVNGDGRDDILIGAPRNDEGGTNAGQTYLNFGGSVKVACEAVPATVFVHPGAWLWFSVNIVNMMDSTLTFQVWADAVLPNGSFYAGNPVLGPVTLTFGPGHGVYQVQRGLPVPLVAPLGEYELWISAGWHNSAVWSQDGFEFWVVEELTGEWLFWDDGTYENGVSTATPGYTSATGFSPETVPCMVESIKCWIDDENNWWNPGDIYVLDDAGGYPNNVIGGPYTVQAQAPPQWVQVAVSVPVIQDRFYVGLECVDPSANGPYVGADTDQPCNIEHQYWGTVSPPNWVLLHTYGPPFDCFDLSYRAWVSHADGEGEWLMPVRSEEGVDREVPKGRLNRPMAH